MNIITTTFFIFFVVFNHGIAEAEISGKQVVDLGCSQALNDFKSDLSGDYNFVAEFNDGMKGGLQFVEKETYSELCDEATSYLQPILRQLYSNRSKLLESGFKNAGYDSLSIEGFKCVFTYIGDPQTGIGIYRLSYMAGRRIAMGAAMNNTQFFSPFKKDKLINSGLAVFDNVAKWGCPSATSKHPENFSDISWDIIKQRLDKPGP